ncbi:DDB1- and CUL4-associated factor 11 [Nymphon striatum]|nr:DDB1- and CUL4-associated factor 11 [Nymphon striatum]
MGKTVPGTRSYHHYTPISTTEISYKRTSEHEFEQHFNLSKVVQVINDDAPLPNLNDFVACRYDTFWWVGIVDEIEAEKKDFKIKFMHPHGPSKRFSWPERDDSCWVPINNMIAVIGFTNTFASSVFFLCSGQVRVITSDNSAIFHRESERTCFDIDSEPLGGFNDPNLQGSQNLDTSLLNASDFKAQVLRDSEGWPKAKDAIHKNENLPSSLFKREIGSYSQQNFDSTGKMFNWVKHQQVAVLIQHFSKVLICSLFIPNRSVGKYVLGHKVFCGTYSNDGNLFMSAAQDAYIRIYDVSKGRHKEMKCVAARDVGWSILDSVFSPNGQFFAYSSWSECLHICNVYGDLDVHEPLSLTPGNRRFCVFSISYSQDGKELIGGACDACIYIYDIETKTRISQILSHEDDVNSVVFSDDTSQIVFSGGDDGLCKVWDRRTLNESSPKPVGILAGHLDGITFIDSKHDGRHLITNSKDQTIKLWDIRVFSTQEGQEATRFSVSHQSWDYRFSEIPRNLSGMKRRNLGDTSLMTYSGHYVLQTLIRCRFSPKFTTGQRYIYTGCANGRVIVYDALTGEIVRTLSKQVACVRDVSWHPYNMELMSSSWDGTVVKWSYRETIDDSNDDMLDVSSDSSTDKFGSVSLCGLRRSRRLRRNRSRTS